MSGSVCLADFVIKGEKAVNYNNAVKSLKLLMFLLFLNGNIEHFKIESILCEIYIMK